MTGDRSECLYAKCCSVIKWTDLSRPSGKLAANTSLEFGPHYLIGCTVVPTAET